jgi:hypothetical protein
MSRYATTTECHPKHAKTFPDQTDAGKKSSVSKIANPSLAPIEDLGNSTHTATPRGPGRGMPPIGAARGRPGRWCGGIPRLGSMPSWTRHQLRLHKRSIAFGIAQKDMVPERPSPISPNHMAMEEFPWNKSSWISHGSRAWRVAHVPVHSSCLAW